MDALRAAPCLAPLALGLPRLFQRLGERHGVGLAAVALGPPVGDFGIEFGEAVALRQPLRGRARGIGGGDESVPAPQVAVLADQPLPGLQSRLQPCTIRLVDEPDLVEAALQQAASRNELAERRCAGGQGRVALAGDRAGPVQRRIRVGRGFEVIAQRRAKRGLVARSHLERIDDRRPQDVPPALRMRVSVCASASSRLSCVSISCSAGRAASSAACAACVACSPSSASRSASAEAACAASSALRRSVTVASPSSSAASFSASRATSAICWLSRATRFTASSRPRTACARRARTCASASCAARAALSAAATAACAVSAAALASAKACSSPAASASSRSFPRHTPQAWSSLSPSSARFARLVGFELCQPLAQFLAALFGAAGFFGQLLGKDGSAAASAAPAAASMSRSGCTALSARNTTFCASRSTCCASARSLISRPCSASASFSADARRDPADVVERRLGLADIARHRAVARREPRLPLQLSSCCSPAR
jgi:hypothetical protein